MDRIKLTDVGMVVGFSLVDFSVKASFSPTEATLVVGPSIEDFSVEASFSSADPTSVVGLGSKSTTGIDSSLMVGGVVDDF